MVKTVENVFKVAFLFAALFRPNLIRVIIEINVLSQPSGLEIDSPQPEDRMPLIATRDPVTD